MPTNITNKDWYLVPVVNPDGYAYTHTNDRLWRKNRARIGNSPVGVDLNRNFGETITFPWCFTSDPCPDYVNLLEGATVMAKAIFDTSGRMYKVGNFKDVMYPASGTSIDWSYGIARIPFSYLVELRSKEYKFLLPKEQILDCCTEIIPLLS
ncbi:unnamed protein product, partial [Iphiclides podalirius]